MDEDRFNMAVRKFLKEVGVTSQREIERIVREGALQGAPQSREEHDALGEYELGGDGAYSGGARRNE